MTVGNFSECLLNDSNGALGVSSTFISSTTSMSSISSSSSSSSIASQSIEDIIEKAEPIVLTTFIATPISDSVFSSTKSSPQTTTNISTTTTTTYNNNNNSNTTAHSLGYLKKMRSAPKTGRNHAGAKYLASQYTSSK